MPLTNREFREVKIQLSQVGFKLFKTFLDERAVSKEIEAQTYAESILTLLLREQSLGSARELRVIMEEFENYVDNQIKQTQENEKSNE